MRTKRTIQSILTCGLAAVLVMFLAAPASATNYTVTTNPYTVSHTKLAADLWNTYELTAAAGQQVSYGVTVTTTAGCASLLYVQGHNANANSQYYVSYSQENCVQTYVNTFPVDSRDGTLFTVAVLSEYSGDVAYNLTISIATPVIPSWVLGLAIFIGIGVVAGIIGWAIRRRRKPAPPPFQPGMPGYPPGAPPQMPPQPPMEPGQPPQNPPF